MTYFVSCNSQWGNILAIRHLRMRSNQLWERVPLSLPIHSFTRVNYLLEYIRNQAAKIDRVLNTCSDVPTRWLLGYTTWQVWCDLAFACYEQPAGSIDCNKPLVYKTSIFSRVLLFFLPLTSLQLRLLFMLPMQRQAVRRGPKNQIEIMVFLLTTTVRLIHRKL